MYYREISGSATGACARNRYKVRAQNFCKAPRQRDRSLRKEPRQRDQSLCKEPQL